MLRTRYGTEIQVGTAIGSVGIANIGPGKPTIQDLLVTGAQFPPAAPGPNNKQWGLYSGVGNSIYCGNVSVWGCQAGWKIDGNCTMQGCWASACGNVGVECDGGVLWANAPCGVFGTTLDGWLTHTGILTLSNCLALGNGRNGIVAVSGGNGYIVNTWNYNNGAPDFLATTAAQISAIGCTFNTSSPPANTTGNTGATVSSGPYPTQP